MHRLSLPLVNERRERKRRRKEGKQMREYRRERGQPGAQQLPPRRRGGGRRGLGIDSLFAGYPEVHPGTLAPTALHALEEPSPHPLTHSSLLRVYLLCRGNGWAVTGRLWRRYGRQFKAATPFTKNHHNP
ncbi:hypothetical protein E2C01_051176 [Portunus trituberculatus]|uniref:Uncharacterized protein n=1 Tax=Portunus trituberculatus TaxID=210409 RepID=A0A5B7GAV7_PORTR|nr:hypothetical protein [Portunus trituberculatus]